jgi:hypothetical protein
MAVDAQRPANEQISNWDLAFVSLMPCVAEQFVQVFNGQGNLAMYGVARGIQLFRNALCVGLTLLVIGIIGTVAGSSSAGFTAAIIVGSIITPIAIKRLSDFANMLRNALNAQAQQADAANARMVAVQQALAANPARARDPQAFGQLTRSDLPLPGAAH